MTWGWVAVIVVPVVLAVIVGAWLGRAARLAAAEGDGEVYVIMWNDAVVGVTSSRAVATRFCTAQHQPDRGHYVRWLPFTVNGNFQVLKHDGS